MFYRYEVKNNGKEDILYLYMDMKSEFSKELTSNSDEELSRRTINFITNNNIKFNGKKVFLIIDGIVVKSVDVSRMNKAAKNNPNYTNKNFLVNVKLENNSYIELNLEKYLLSTLAHYYNDNIEDETLKCISILYRTYAYKEMHENKYIDACSPFIEFREISSYKIQWSDFYDAIYNRLLRIINETDCLFISYNNKYILPFIHICNNGNTLSNKNYGYLSSVSSLWDLACVHNKEILDFDYESISKLFGFEITYNSKFEITEVDNNNQITKIQIDKIVFTGEELRKILSLKSLNFNVILYHNFVRIITFGFGNSLGLSIYGSNELAKDGIDYPNILKYYFPKTKLNKYIIKKLP